ncbi:MAG: FtsX-like permease family protein [Coriobacteriia bacterium]|nr:FtsX-like permease family protein [Coriobacteriia bacterium]
MKPTQLIEVFRNIRTTLVSFVAIVLFVALGIGLWNGMDWTLKASKNTSEDFFQAQNLHHFEIVYPYGLTSEDIQQISREDGVTYVEGTYLDTAKASFAGEKQTAILRSLPQRLDQLQVVEGTLPTKANELAMNVSFAQAQNLAVGDTIVFEADATNPDDPDGMDRLTQRTFTITALVTSPAYLCSTVQLVLWLPVESFDAAAFHNGFTSLLVSCDALNSLPAYETGYAQASADIEGRLTTLAETLGTKRYDAIKTDAQAEIDRKKAELEDGKAKIAAKEAELEDGKAQMASGEAQLADARIQAAQGEAQLADARIQAVQGEARLDAARQEASAGQSQLDQIYAMIPEAEAYLAQLEADLANAQASEQDLQAQIATAEATIQTLKDSIANEEQQQAALEVLIANLEQGLPDTAEQLEEAQAQLAAVQAQLQEHLAQLGDEESILDNAQQLLAEVVANLPEKEEAVAQARQIEGEARAKLAEAEAKLADAWAQIAEGEAQLEDGYAQMAVGEAQLADGYSQISAGETRLTDARTQIADGEAQLADARAQASEGEVRLIDAQGQLDKMQRVSSSVQNREWLTAYQFVRQLTNTLVPMRSTMALLFIIIGLLVCYSVVSRLVNEQVTQMGTKKALGFHRREIAQTYLAYSLIAVLVGALVAIPIAMGVVEMIIIPKCNRFLLPDPAPVFQLPDFLLISAIELVLILAAAWAACFAVTRRNATDLLRGEDVSKRKQHFYERTGAWKRMGLLSQTIINNCINDKWRVIGTLIGVMGCAALVVSAFTMYDNISLRTPAEYEKTIHYDMSVGITAQTEEEAAKPAAAGSVQSQLDQAGLTNALVHNDVYMLSHPNGNTTTINVIVPEDYDSMKSLVNLRNLSDGNQVETLEGAWVSQAFAQFYNLKVGDEIKLTSLSGQPSTVPIAGIFQLVSDTNLVVLTPEAYKEHISSGLTYETVLVSTNGLGFQAGSAQAATGSDYLSCTNAKQNFEDNIQIINTLALTVVLIYVMLSITMAIFVLLNLNFMFVNEKKRELIVLMINGYSTRAAKRYIYQDTIVLTIIGLLLGCVLGSVMGVAYMHSLCNATLAMPQHISPLSCVLGSVLCAGLAAAMSMIALARIPRFHLTDINRL